MLKNQNNRKTKRSIRRSRRVLRQYQTRYSGVIWQELQAILPPRPIGKLGFRSGPDVKQLQWVPIYHLILINILRAHNHMSVIQSKSFGIDEWWVPMEEIRAENSQRKSLPTSLLSLHSGSGMPSSETGTILCQYRICVCYTSVSFSWVSILPIELLLNVLTSRCRDAWRICLYL